MIRSFDFDLREFKAQNPSSLNVQLAFGVSHMEFNFVVKGEEPHRFPSLLSENLRKRKDELWKTDCFEIFWDYGGESYYELNLSPLGHWQVYSFQSERKRREEFDVHPPILSSTIHPNGYSLVGRLQLDNQNPTAPYKSHPCVILNDGPGGFRYYASSHPQKAPDFHDKSHWKVL